MFAKINKLDNEPLRHKEPLEYFPEGMTKEAIARDFGYVAFDCTLPQTWLNQHAELATRGGLSYSEAYGILLCGTIWSYDNSPLFGEPAFLSMPAKRVYELACVKGL